MPRFKRKLQKEKVCAVETPSSPTKISLEQASSLIKAMEAEICQLQIQQSKMIPRVIHPGSECSTCGRKDIAGVKYKCLICICFEQCSNCELTDLHNHPMIRVSSPIDSKLEEGLINKVQKWTSRKPHNHFCRETRNFESPERIQRRKFLIEKFNNPSDVLAINELINRYRSLNFQEFKDLIDQLDRMN